MRSGGRLRNVRLTKIVTSAAALREADAGLLKKSAHVREKRLLLANLLEHMLYALQAAAGGSAGGAAALPRAPREEGGARHGR